MGSVDAQFAGQEEKEKFEEIVELLVAAGYFRARIKGLSPFDKIIGGMTWCIETCSFDIDIDLFYSDTLSLGQKITLTEKIVRVLLKMECPHRIEPHQIEGLDTISIFPVIQWLVKRAVEQRREMEDENRSFSLHQFEKHVQLPSDLTKREREAAHFDNLAQIRVQNRPVRTHRRKTPFGPDVNEAVRVMSTLMEYGSRSIMASTGEAEGDKTVDMPSEGIMSSELEYASFQKMSTSTLGKIISMSADAMVQAATEYIQFQEQGKDQIGLPQFKSNLRKQVELLQVRCHELEEAKIKVKEKLKELKAKYEAATNEAEVLSDELKQLKSQLDTANDGDIHSLKRMVQRHEELQKEEKEFRISCKEELEALQKEIRELETFEVPVEEGTEIEEALNAQKEKVKKLRLEVAEKSHVVASLQRQLDDVPLQAELLQYQKRFLELYHIGAAKHKETKHFYTLHNSLCDTKLYLEKEVKLIDSVIDNFNEAMSTPEAKQEFLAQFESIVSGIKGNKMKVDEKKVNLVKKKESLQAAIQKITEIQRLYFKTVKDFQTECHRNETLSAHLSKA
ncbi:unnamed protein product [Darwinula stevensoni]|uniref:Coiled-coil domain-containing protein 93 n=1 Tax=Darwinula stevensoni TaxID=69355 RepID=A0A7R9AAA8_9CRUS|nr:unnamed protein product [Darwinula stevensoni]CAG0897994.1 unnamed protein product [Darwinula stevensoni]